MHWKARRQLFDMTAKFIYVAVLCASAFVGGMLISNAKASSYDGIYTPEVIFKAGDLVTLPNRKGTYIMALWGSQPVFYNGEVEWFQYDPIRNWQTVYIDITRQIPEGDYQFLEVEVMQPGGNPNNLNDWRWVREYKARVIKCDFFTAYYADECARGAKR